MKAEMCISHQFKQHTREASAELKTRIRESWPTRTIPAWIGIAVLYKNKVFYADVSG